jgi:hypothetical protein
VEILKKFGMTHCKSMPTPMVMDLKKMNKASTDSENIDPNLYRQLIGSLMYLVNTRPNICYAVNVLSRFMSQSRQTHWIEAKHVLRYLQGTIRYGLRYASSVDMILQGYVDADWARSVVEWKRKSGWCFTLGSAMVSWCSRKHSFVDFSTTEEKYRALSVPVCEAVWLHNLLTYLFDHEMDSTIIHCDNQIYVKLSENILFHDILKHIEIKYHYIRDMVQRKVVNVRYLPTHEQDCRYLHQTVAKMKFEYFHERLGLVENASLAERKC